MTLDVVWYMKRGFWTGAWLFKVFRRYDVVSLKGFPNSNSEFTEFQTPEPDT